jgi:hypothetical protein
MVIPYGGMLHHCKCVLQIEVVGLAEIHTAAIGDWSGHTTLYIREAPPALPSLEVSTPTPSVAWIQRSVAAWRRRVMVRGGWRLLCGSGQRGPASALARGSAAYLVMRFTSLAHSPSGMSWRSSYHARPARYSRNRSTSGRNRSAASRRFRSDSFRVSLSLLASGWISGRPSLP